MQPINSRLDFGNIRGVVLDMDGVTWAGAQILPGVPDFFLFLREQHIPFVLATNNSSKNVDEYVARLGKLGIPVDADTIVTSGTVTAEALARQYPPHTPIYVIGSASLIQLLTSFGYDIDPAQAKIVVVGLDTTLTYDKLRIAGQRILAGADFIGTNGDLTLPSAEGIMPGNGSTLAALQAMTGCVPRLMGKPEPIMFEVALERLGTSASQTLMVGDRLDTDIVGAHRAGLRTAMVLTGISTRKDIDALPSEDIPDGVYDSLATLLEIWRKLVRPMINTTMHAKSVRRLLWIVLALMALTLMWASIGNPVTAQTYDPTHRFATVVPSPTNNGGKATWQIKTMSFVSNYPKGFDFVLDVTSTGGPIALATVVWRHSTINSVNPTFEVVKADTSGEYIAHWVPFAGHNIPQWVGVDFWWTLTDAAGNVFETPHGYAEYADNTRQWRRLVSEDVVVHWEASLPDDIGKQVVAAMRDQRATYLRDWGRLLDYKPQIVIYASGKPWQEWQPDVDLKTVDGETSAEWGTTVQIYRTDVAQPTHYLAYAIVLHEMEHLYQAVFGKLGVYPMPLWAYEGDATYLQRDQEYDYLQAVKDLAAKGALPSLQNGGPGPDQDRLAYDEGFAFWKWLEVRYGADEHRKVWALIARGQSIDISLELATGRKFADLEVEFRTWLGTS